MEAPRMTSSRVGVDPAHAVRQFGGLPDQRVEGFPKTSLGKLVVRGAKE